MVRCGYTNRINLFNRFSTYAAGNRVTVAPRFTLHVVVYRDAAHPNDRRCRGANGDLP